MPRPNRHYLTLSACLLILLGALTPARAGRTGLESVPEARPAWSASFRSPVTWQRVTPLGQLLVCTRTGVHGVDPVDGRIVWSHPRLGPFAERHYEEIGGTPLVALADGDERPRVVILNPVDGRVIFDSRQADLDMVLSRHVLPRSRGLLVFGFPQETMRTSMLLFDATTGERRWTNSDLMAGAGRLTATLLSLYQAHSGLSGVTAEPVEVAGDAFLVGTAMHTMSVDGRSGEIRWTIKNPDDVRRTRFYQSRSRPGVVFVGNETASTGRSGGESVHSHFSAHRLSDGVSLWPAPARIKGGLNDVIFLDGGLVVGPRTEGRGAITMLDYATGQSRWGRNGKGITIRGGIVDHDMTDAGLLLVTGYDSAWTDKGTEYGLNVLDTASGSLRFKKPVRLMGRIVSTEVTPRGILYVTTSEVNILDPRTGEPRLREPIVSKDSLITARYGHQLYVFSQDAGALYRIDTYQGVAHRLSTTTVRLEEDAAPMALEIGRDTITVVSNQNIIVFNPDGSLKLRAHHPAPRHPALVRALLRARSLGAGMAAFASGVSGGAFGTASRNRPEGSPDRVITAGLAQGYADMAEDYASLSGAYAAAARARFGASATSRDFVFMMVSYTRSGYALAKVSKKSGEVLEVINLGHDKEPIYEVDSLAGRIYYRPTPTRIDGYRF